MKKILLILALITFQTTVFAETADWLWPILGKNAGNGIIYRPEDYIGKELNYENLIIEGKMGDSIVCPADGTLKDISIIYNTSLTSSTSFDGQGTVKDIINEHKDEIEKKYGDSKYLCGMIGIETKNGNIWITGIMPKNSFKTGVKVHRGDILGTMMYAYKGINKPCILISHSIYGKPADPMTEFGLKSTFKVPAPSVMKSFLTRKEATEDYRKLANSVREIYPSLDELMSYADYDAFVENQLSTIPEHISIKKFAKMLEHFNSKIHDSHFYINTSVADEKPTKGLAMMLSPLLFSKIGDKVIITMTTDPYKAYMGKTVTSVDGIPIDRIVNMTSDYSVNYDAQVKSVTEYRLANYLTFNYYWSIKGPLPANSKVTIVFNDGKKVTAPLFKYSEMSKHFGKPFIDYVQNLYVNGYQGGTHHKVCEIDSTTAYLGLGSFELSEVELDEVTNFIKKMAEKRKPDLIIDLRNNSGGEEKVLNRIVSYLIDKPTVRQGCYEKVNKKYFESEICNIPRDMSMFEDYDSIPGKQGLYIKEDNGGLKPDSTIHYNGRIYVLQNSNSASASADFAGFMVRNHQGYIVGQESCTAYGFMTAEKFANIYLNNSQISAIIPMVKCVMDNTESSRLPHGRGVIPDLTVPLTQQSCYGPQDYVLHKTLELIKNGIYLGENSFKE